jgi:large conductance mechanosensitive channel
LLSTEFKNFALRGNVLDLAIGVIIGGAFGKIVSSLVSDLFMPVIGFLTSGVSFRDLKVVLKPAVLDGATVLKPEVALTYGNFLQTTVDFLIVALSIFLFIQLINKAKARMAKKEAAAEAAAAAATEASPPARTETDVLLEEIRDLLKQQANGRTDPKPVPQSDQK